MHEFVTHKEETQITHVYFSLWGNDIFPHKTILYVRISNES